MPRSFGVICGAFLASISFLSALFAQTASGLVERFENTTAFWEQFDVAKKIVALHDKSVLPQLEPWLRCEDMRRRGNAAFVFEDSAMIEDSRLSRLSWRTVRSNALCSRSTARATRVQGDKFVRTVTTPRTFLAI